MRPRGLVATIAFVAVVLAGALVLRLGEPTDQSWLPKCTMHRITGWHCPGCGATRAGSALVRGDFLAALRYNAMLVLGIPALGIVLWWHDRRQRSTGRMLPITGWIVLFVVVAFFLARNLPTPSTSPLAPPPWPSTTTTPQPVAR